MLNGRFANTAFCLLAPDGKERLSRSGRSPLQAFSRRGSRGGDTGVQGQLTVAAMEKIARHYKPTGDVASPVVQDFHSFRQALNVASGDQRLLLFVAAPEDDQDEIRKTLSPVMGDAEVVGRFHVDFSNKGDEKWSDSVRGVKSKSKPSLLVIQSDKFGQQGKVVKQLPADATAEQIKSALLSSNQRFARTEKRKVYGAHVEAGRRAGVYFEGGVEYGEDRDGDGEVDRRRGRGGR